MKQIAANYYEEISKLNFLGTFPVNCLWSDTFVHIYI